MHLQDARAIVVTWDGACLRACREEEVDMSVEPEAPQALAAAFEVRRVAGAQGHTHKGVARARTLHR